MWNVPSRPAASTISISTSRSGRPPTRSTISPITSVFADLYCTSPVRFVTSALLMPRTNSRFADLAAVRPRQAPAHGGLLEEHAREGIRVVLGVVVDHVHVEDGLHRRGRVAGADVRQVVTHLPVELDPPLLDQPAHHEVHGGLRDRLDAVRLIGTEVGSVALEQDGAVASRHHAGEVRGPGEAADALEVPDAAIDDLPEPQHLGRPDARGCSGRPCACCGRRDGAGPAGSIPGRPPSPTTRSGFRSVGLVLGLTIGLLALNRRAVRGDAARASCQVTP